MGEHSSTQENHIGSAVIKIFWYIHTDTQTHRKNIMLLLFKDMHYFLPFFGYFNIQCFVNGHTDFLVFIIELLSFHTINLSLICYLKKYGYFKIKDACLV